MLRQQAEELIQCRAHQDVAAPADTLELIHELKIHQAELEIQNEELKRAQQELSQLHRQYERLYEFAPCGYVTLDARGIISHVNLSGVTLLGAPRSALLHSGLSLYIAENWENTYLAARKRAADNGEIQSVDLLLKKENQPSQWVRADIQADRDEDNSCFSGASSWWISPTSARPNKNACGLNIGFTKPRRWKPSAPWPVALLTILTTCLP